MKETAPLDFEGKSSQYMGCYEDEWHPRDFKNQLGQV